MLSAGDTVVVGVSGGADSVSLLHFLVSASEELGINAVAAHLNHGIRGEEAHRDETFVRELCAAVNVPLFVRRADCPAEAKKLGIGTEEAGRRLRYSFFEELSSNYAAAKIATAHTADDNAETVLFNLARGSSLKGISGIPAVRGRIIRPLILCSRREVEEYCARNALSYVTDSTNLEDDYTRNLIRHKVMPVLASVNPDAVCAIGRLSRLAREDDALLNAMAHKLWDKAYTGGSFSFDAQLLAEAPSPVVSRLIRNAYALLTGEEYMSAGRTLAAQGVLKGGAAVQLHKYCFAELKNGSFRLYDKNKKHYAIEGETPVDFNGFCRVAGGVTLRGTYLGGESVKINGLLKDNMVDCDTICGILRLRGRRNGDTITLPRRSVTKSLKKLFCEQKIPQEQRAAIPVLADDNGVVWVMGFGADKKHIAGRTAKNILYIEGEGQICSTI